MVMRGPWAVAAEILVVIVVCGSPARSADPPAATQQGKRVLHVDSYHEGYEWSDDIRQGIASVFAGSGVVWKSIAMDSKRRSDEAQKLAAAAAVKAEIDRWQPDLVIASDDNASKYVVAPYLKNGKIPVVFCGVNWDGAKYGYPYRNATGMLEVEFGQELVAHLRRYAKGDRFGFLAADNESDRADGKNYLDRFAPAGSRGAYVRTFAEFQSKFLELQSQVDSLYILNNAGIAGWDADQAEAFMAHNTRVPTGSHNVWMARYTLITLGKYGQEQGQWAASTALRILAGSAPSGIPITRNARARLIVNLKIADHLGIVFNSAILKTAEIWGRAKLP
jgi:ABC-type uncharacterized transport system substrate-binding protein